MKKILNLQPIHLLITMILLYSITAITPRLISRYLTTYFYLGVMALCLLLLILSYEKKLADEYIFLMIPFFMWKIWVYLVSSPSLVYWVYGVILDFVPIMIGLSITRKLDYRSTKYFSIVIVLAVTVTMITTYFGLLQYPNAARYIATVADSNEALFVRYNMMNIGGYDFVYTTVLLYPLVIYAYKRGKINLFWTVIIAVLELIFIITSVYTTAFLLWIVSSIFIFFRKDLKVRNLVFVAIFAFIFVVGLSELVSNGLKAIADLVGNDDISDRLYSLADGKTGLENADDNRWEVWTISFNEFIRHPLFGNMAYGGGGHSFFLDTLAEYGLFGGAMIGVMLVMIFRVFFSPYRNTKGYGYVVWMFIQVMILMVVNPTIWLYQLCLYIPVLLALINKGDTENESAMGNQLGIA